MLAGVSTDTVERHRQFRAQNDPPFPLVADPTRQIAKLYDVRRRFGLGTSRVTYVVDREVVIQGVFHNELDMTSHVRQVLATLHRLQG